MKKACDLESLDMNCLNQKGLLTKKDGVFYFKSHVPMSNVEYMRHLYVNCDDSYDDVRVSATFVDYSYDTLILVQ